MREKLWHGRFESAPSKITEEISESISYDHALYKVDIRASKAHARILMQMGVLTPSEFQQIEKGLATVEEEIAAGKMIFSPALEDIHMHVESRLTQIIGEVGKKLHTGRSRNDQVAVDTHLFVRAALDEHKKDLRKLLVTLHSLAEKHFGKIWIGYTHLQIAQPALLSHYLLSYFWQFARDTELLTFVENSVRFSPLGSAALGGVNYPIDRAQTAKELGFDAPYPNSMDAVSNRDYQLNYHFGAVRLFLHISRFCEDVIIYNSTEFGYVTLGDAVTTGSSIMPQKKNPDIAELLRGKTGRVNGNLQALITNLKGLPMTYNRDLQEDKVYLFDSINQVRQGLLGLTEILNHIQFNEHRVLENLSRGFALATDVADFLVREKNVPFRDAHAVAGAAVKFAETHDTRLENLTAADWQKIAGYTLTFPQDFFTPLASVARRQGYGSTNPDAVKMQLDEAKAFLEVY
ncbi:MAG TPA: argininosuccinate lyase [Turneriella sp.]|nr:argininosuccinate lyase [Turneriella sp.]